MPGVSLCLPSMPTTPVSGPFKSSIVQWLGAQALLVISSMTLAELSHFSELQLQYFGYKMKIKISARENSETKIEIYMYHSVCVRARVRTCVCVCKALSTQA